MVAPPARPRRTPCAETERERAGPVTSTADQREATRLSARLRAVTRAHHDEVQRTGFVSALRDRRLPWKAYADWLSQLFFIHEALVQAEAAMVGDAIEPVLVRSSTASLPALAADLRFLYGPAWGGRVTARTATTVCCTHLRDVAFRRFSGFVGHHYTRHAADLAAARHVGPAVAAAYGLDGGGIRFLWPDAGPFAEQYAPVLDAVPDTAAVLAQATRAHGMYLDVLDELGRAWA